MMGRILIVFDTKGGSTKEIIQWIREGAASKGARVDVKSPNAVTSLDYDLIVVGTPIYNDRPMVSVQRFLEAGRLHDKKMALFVVCFAGIFGMRNFMVRKYLDELQGKCAGVVIKQTSFDSAMGPWRKVNKAVCIDFGKELASLPYGHSTAMEAA
jgi:menaquinone-dependent protoporphyrinogen oxidase